MLHVSLISRACPVISLYKSLKMRKLLLLCILATGYASCKHTEPAKESAGIETGKDTIVISSSSPVLNKLEKQRVTVHPYCYQLTTSGIVKAIPNYYALIAAPFTRAKRKCFWQLKI